MSGRSLDEASRLVRERIGQRRLIWFGKRGADSAPLRHLEQFYGCYSILAPLTPDGCIEVASLETLGGLRNDTANLDTTPDAHAQTLIDALDVACAQPAVLVSYRTYGFTNKLIQSRPGVEFLGIPYRYRSYFEDKPFVEQELSRAGVTTLSWHDIPPGDRRGYLAEQLIEGPVVLRLRRSSSGEGHELISSPEALQSSRLIDEDDDLSFSPYLEDHLPLNIAGCVFRDGAVTLHAPSLQLIGLPLCTSLDFGYCGNDFGAIKQVEEDLLSQLEAMAITAGRWLHQHSYTGAFGVDAMVSDGKLLFVEINPRFQGSSRLSAEIDASLGLPDIYLDHLMAWLDLGSYQRPTVADLTREQRALSHILCYNNGSRPLQLSSQAAWLGTNCELLPKPGIAVSPGSLLLALRFPYSVTQTGRSLLPSAEAATLDCLTSVGAYL